MVSTPAACSGSGIVKSFVICAGGGGGENVGKIHPPYRLPEQGTSLEKMDW